MYSAFSNQISERDLVSRVQMPKMVRTMARTMSMKRKGEQLSVGVLGVLVSWSSQGGIVIDIFFLLLHISLSQSLTTCS